MFDFGNKKLIEDLKREVKFQNNLVGVGLAIQDELKKKNEILEKEKIEYQKTIEFLISEIDKLKEKNKKLEEEIETEKVGIKVPYEKFSGKMSGIKCFEIIDYKYKETSDNIIKNKMEIEDYIATYFTKRDSVNVINPDEIKDSQYNKIIYTYKGIPYRSFQDLWYINKFLESDKYIDYRKECRTEEIREYVTKQLCNNKLICKIFKKNIDEVIKKINKDLNGETEYHGIKLYKQRTLLTFYGYIFESKKEFMNIIKYLIYKRKI